MNRLHNCYYKLLKAILISEHSRQIIWFHIFFFIHLFTISKSIKIHFTDFVVISRQRRVCFGGLRPAFFRKIPELTTSEFLAIFHQYFNAAVIGNVLSVSLYGAKTHRHLKTLDSRFDITKRHQPPFTKWPYFVNEPYENLILHCTVYQWWTYTYAIWIDPSWFANISHFVNGGLFHCCVC